MHRMWIYYKNLGDDLLMSIKECPVCGSKNITISEWYSIQIQGYHKKLTCRDCGYEREEY